MASALGLDAEALAAAPVDPPSPAGDLRAEIDRFTSLDACVAEHAKTDPLVGDALKAIGYETFLRDACRVLDAMKQKKSEACRPIDAQGLRSKCESYVAMQEGKPDACPWDVEGTPTHGRDARCVAVASREPRLCAGTPRGERSTCEALLAKDEKKCGADASCARDTTRWRNVLPGPPPEPGTPLATRAKIDVRGIEGTADPASVETDLSVDFARGVVVTEDFAGSHFELGASREVGTTVFAPTPQARTRLALALLLVEGKPPSVEHAEVAVPGGATLVVPGARWDGLAKVTKLEAKRGGELALTLDGSMGTPPHAYRVRVEVTTFVRDVVKLGSPVRRR